MTDTVQQITTALTPVVIPRDQDFLTVLRQEKRRADRVERPLSLVVLRPEPPSTHAQDSLRTVLHRVKRETDSATSLPQGEVAVLLPDTSAAGREDFIERMRSGLREADLRLSLSATAATYPDQGFERIERGLQVAGDGALLFDETPTSAAGDYAGKRTLDLLGAGAALLLLAPLMAAVALAVAWSSPGPVIFRQQRLGRDGRPFEFLKFRSMACNTDDTVHRQFVATLIRPDRSAPEDGSAEVSRPLSEDQAATSEPTPGPATLYKLRSDPRVTPVGRFLRRTSLDELPQLFNVLRGDMSLVGPRPPIAYEARNYRAWHLRRLLQARPGITGAWQVNGRSRVPFDDMVRMDLRYIEQCSLALDLRILLKTVGVVLRGDGAR